MPDPFVHLGGPVESDAVNSPSARGAPFQVPDLTARAAIDPTMLTVGQIVTVIVDSSNGNALTHYNITDITGSTVTYAKLTTGGSTNATWPLGTPWSTIGPIISGTFGQLNVQPDPTMSTRLITAAGGPWDLSGIEFIAPSEATIEFEAGAALLPTGGAASLSTDGVNVLLNGTVVPSGTLMTVRVIGDLSNRGSTVGFPEVADGSTCTVIAATVNGRIQALGSGNVMTVADSSGLTVVTARSTTIFGGAFSGPVSGTGFITLTTDNESQSRVGNGAFGTAIVTVSQVNGFVQLRTSDGVIAAHFPVMPSSTTNQAPKAWDGVDPDQIIGSTVTPASDGSLVLIVEQFGILTQWTSDGSAAISRGQILNFSTSNIGYVTPLGSPTDSGIFATVARSAVSAMPGLLVQGAFRGARSSSSGLFAPVSTKTANYTAHDYELVLCDPTAGGFTITAPPANTAHAFIVKNKSASANTITIAAAGLDLIDGASTYSLVVPMLGYGSVTLYSDGVSNWMVI